MVTGYAGAVGLLRASNAFREIVPRDAVTVTISLIGNGLAAVTGNVISVLPAGAATVAEEVAFWLLIETPTSSPAAPTGSDRVTLAVAVSPGPRFLGEISILKRICANALLERKRAGSRRLMNIPDKPVISNGFRLEAL